MSSPDAAVRAIRAAISRGAPLYNSGDVAGCAALYMETARATAVSGSLTDLSSLELVSLLQSPPADANTRAWALRHAFDRFLGDVSFIPRTEAKLPEGFPRPGKAGRIEEKKYPGARAAVATQDGKAFGLLFRHISTNQIAMTTPVLSHLVDGNAVDMAFFYATPTLGAPTRPQDGVSVVNIAPMRVLSVGMRGGETGEPPMALAKRLLEARLALGDVAATGEWRQLSYNSPMVPPSERFWELQVAIKE
jgi:hypothetical protein